MKKIYLSAFALTLMAGSAMAAPTAEQPTHLQAGLRMVIATNGQMDPTDTQHLEGLEPGPVIDGYETLQTWNCNFLTGEPVTPYSEIFRTEGSKVYYYNESMMNDWQEEAVGGIEEASNWHLIYDFNPTIGEEFKVLGSPGILRCRCVEKTEADPEFNGLSTLTMEIKIYDPDRDEDYPWDTEKWIVGLGSPAGLLHSGFSLLCGGGGHSMCSAFVDDEVLFESSSARRYNSYTTAGYSFIQATDPKVSISVGPWIGGNPFNSFVQGVVFNDLSGAAASRSLGGMYVSGNCVYYANIPASNGREEWGTIYDFSLQPGDITELSRVHFEPFSDAAVMPSMSKIWVECISVEPFEYDPTFTAMHLMAYSDPGFTQPHGPVTWIKGVGSLAGLLNNFPDQSFESSVLSSVTRGKTEVFNNPAASVREVTAASYPTEATEIYDLSGCRVFGSPDALPAGIYIRRSADGVSKIAVR